MSPESTDKSPPSGGLLQLVYTGECLPGFDRAIVRLALERALKLDAAHSAHLFSGQRVIVRQGVNAGDAARYVEHFARMGARLRMEPDAGPPEPAPVAAGDAAAAPRGPVPSSMGAVHAPAREGRLATQAPGVFGLGFSGRLSRRQYASAGAVAVAAGWSLALFMMSRPGGLRVALALLGFLLLALYAVRLAVLRCHDLNRRGAWALLLLVPGVNVVAGLALGLLPGTHGDNDHGEEPDEGHPLVTMAITTVAGLLVAMVVRPQLDDLERQRRPQAGALASAEAATADESPAMEPAAREALAGPYAAAGGHKAFALSAGGGFGWKAGAPSVEAAMEAALADCDARRQPYAAECRVIDLDGEAAE